MISKAALIGLRLVLLFIAARQLTPEFFAAVSIAFTTAEVCRFASDWGVDAVSLRLFSRAKNYNHARRVAKKVIQLKIISSFAGYLLAVATAKSIQPQIPLTWALLIGITCVTSLWFNFVINWYQARSNVRHIAAILAALIITILLLTSHLLEKKYEFDFFLRYFVASEAAIAILILGYFHQKNLKSGIDNKVKEKYISMREIFRQSTPIGIAAIIALTYSRYDQFFLSHASNPNDLANYALAQRIVEPLIFVASALSSTLYARASVALPSLADYDEKFSYIIKWLKLQTTFVASSVCLIVGFIWIFSNNIFPAYDKLFVTSLFVGASVVVRSINILLSAFLQSLGAYSTVLKINLFNLFSIIILISIFGEIFGLFGVSAGALLGEIINSTIQSHKLKNLLRG